MNRKVRICTLCAEKAQGATSCLEKRLNGYNAEVISADFSDPASFVQGIAELSVQADIILAAAPVSMFLNAKLRLLKLVSEKIVRSSSIVAAMGENAPENPKELDLQSAVPEKSKAFASHDGLYSGFAKEYGKGLIIFLPLDEDRLNSAFAGSFGTFFERFVPKKNDSPAPEPVSESDKAPIPAAPKAPKRSALKSHIESAMASGKTIAVSPCGFSKALLSALSTVPDAENTFIPDSAMRDRLEDESIEDYTAQCAKLSKENSDADLGIGISGICNAGDEGEFVIVSVADSERAKAARVFSEPGEDKRHLVAAAVMQLCKMIDELTAEGNPFDSPVPANKAEKSAKNSKIPLIIAGVCVAAAIIVCIVLAVIFGRGTNKADTTYAVGNEAVQMETGVYNYNDDGLYKGGASIDELDIDAFAVTPVTETTAAPTALTTLFQLVKPTTTAPTTKAVTTATTVLTTVKNIITTTTQVLTTKPTTAKPTTTAAPTTTEKTTAAPSTTATSKAESTTKTAAEGKFIFHVYGWGHGVGMSQDGAIKMAKDGSSYDKILTHYFTGTTVKTDPDTPATIKYGDADIPIVEYLCRTAKREIGASSPTEALKAQIVAIYTYAKYYKFTVKKSMHAYDSSYEYAGTNLHKACLEVLGMSNDEDTPKAKYVDYNGSAAFTCYFSNAAGKTASSDSVWGGGNSKYPYLIGGVSSPEEPEATTVEITASEMKKLIEEYAKDNKKEITLGSNPADWLEIISHDSSYSKNTGYITEIRVGNVTMRGNTFRSYVVDFKLRSHCFSFEYVPA